MPYSPNSTAPASWSWTRTDGTNATALMGWNQLVYIDVSSGPNLFPDVSSGPLRVKSYNIGITQEGDAPDYVTGRQDRTAWYKGPIRTEGDLDFPFTWTMGRSLFQAGAELALNPTESFALASSVHPYTTGCKVNSTTLSCRAENMIETRATVWGIVTELDSGFFSEVNPTLNVGSELTDVNSGDGNSPYRTLGQSFGNASGISTSGLDNLNIEQIPMWDACRVQGAPDGMHVVGWEVVVNNNLQRNFTMGDNNGFSPFGMNATSITANQRKITGNITWQSNKAGTISQIIGVGIDALWISIVNNAGVGTGTDMVLQMNQVLWNANPPTVTTGERVTVQSNFTALGNNDSANEFNALIIANAVEEV